MSILSKQKLKPKLGYRDLISEDKYKKVNRKTTFDSIG